MTGEENPMLFHVTWDFVVPTEDGVRRDSLGLVAAGDNAY